eukprot:TRINITY_DN96774_c0_g1_i3.p2 TRINITY_DN96774_c0_g1~~TRINITY_DN96774_c0_g1_i3.p2  ORF type:complete len:124 (+),score=25.60 TRINITY_DN96774_c0_g1_i3:85-456(+)
MKKKKIKRLKKNLKVKKNEDIAGNVISLCDGIASVKGLKKIAAGELVTFQDGTKGMALNLEQNTVGIVVFGDDSKIKQGDEVYATGSIVDINYGKEVIGRIIDAFGIYGLIASQILLIKKMGS